MHIKLSSVVTSQEWDGRGRSSQRGFLFVLYEIFNKNNVVVYWLYNLKGKHVSKHKYRSLEMDRTL